MTLDDMLMIDSTIIVATITLVGIYLKTKMENNNNERVEKHNDHVEQLDIAIKRINDIERRWEDCIYKIMKKK
jgi:uncharacterized protein (UPF0212 family)